MSFNRTKYDQCAYNLEITRSTDPGNYRLFGSFAENANQCLSYDGPVGSKSDVSLAKEPLDLRFNNMAEVESELSWRNQLLTKCNDKKTVKEHTLYHKPTCSKKLVPEDTRFTHPLDNYRCLSLTNYQVEPYLHVNPQCHIQEINDLVGMNSRLFTKDNYKTPTQEFLDKGEALPKEK
jgi:hypothetical protein